MQRIQVESLSAIQAGDTASFLDGFCIGTGAVRLIVSFGWLSLSPIGAGVATGVTAACLAYGAYKMFS